MNEIKEYDGALTDLLTVAKNIIKQHNEVMEKIGDVSVEVRQFVEDFEWYLEKRETPRYVKSPIEGQAVYECECGHEFSRPRLLKRGDEEDAVCPECSSISFEKIDWEKRAEERDEAKLAK